MRLSHDESYNLFMNVKIQRRNLDLAPSLENLVERKSGKARRMLPTFRSHDLDLNVTLEKLSKGKQYQTTLVLTTPQTAIRVEDIEENAASSLVQAFEELFRRIKKFKSQLNRERYWKKETATATAGTLSTRREEVESVISGNLEKIENYIRRELFHRALVDNFPPGVLQPQALVDEIFLEVSANVLAKPENVTMEQWMFSIARETVNRKIQGLEVAREQPHIEESRVETAQWDDEVLNFYQPDEALRLEDLLKDDHCTTPEELLAREETEEQVQKAVASLPRSVRESFVLFALEGFNSDEVAMITGKRPSEVLSDVEMARDELRKHIAE